MSQDNKICEICHTLGHSKFYCKNKPYKPINKVSVKKSNSHEFEVIKKTTKPNKPSRSKIKKELDKLVKDYVKERDDYTCQRCGAKVTGSNCHASHIYPVGSCSLLQFEPLNLKVLCYHCHINWWHKNPIEADEWIKEKFPDRVAILNVMKTVKTKTSTYDLQVLVQEYRQRIKDKV